MKDYRRFKDPKDREKILNEYYGRQKEKRDGEIKKSNEKAFRE